MGDIDTEYILLGVSSLALIVFGVKVMGEGTQKLTGQWIRRILGEKTQSNFSLILKGLVSTSILQSSSTITLIVVSSVNAGMSTLGQAIRIIFGANVGTTSSAWLVFVIGFISPVPIQIASASLVLGVPMLFSGRPRLKNWGELVVGFSILFLAIMFLLISLEHISFFSDGGFRIWMQELSDRPYGGIVGFFLLSVLLTMITQSSTATMIVLLALVAVGLPLPLGMAMVVGENIGTTISSNFAAASGNVYAKRSARAHLIFNVFGLFWVLIFFNPILNGLRSIQYMAPSGILGVQGALCMFHTSFNLVTAFILAFLVEPLKKVIKLLVPSKSREDKEFKLEIIKSGIHAGELSLYDARMEVMKFGKVIMKMSDLVFELLSSTDARKHSRLVKEVIELEILTDQMEVTIANYLSDLSFANLSEKGSSSAQVMLGIINDLERIGDIYYQITTSLERKNESRIYFLPKQRTNLFALYDLVVNALEIMNANLENPPAQFDMAEARKCETAINKKRDSIKKDHLVNVEKGKYNIQAGMIYNDLFESLERIGDHVFYVSDALRNEV
jgi:phosphate:Na+ symporter